MSKTRSGDFIGHGHVTGGWTRTWDISSHRPYTKPQYLDYTETNIDSSYYTTSDPTDSQSSWDTGHAFDTPDFPFVANQAYENFSGTLGDQATWANNLLEAKGSVEMVTKRATQLLGFTAALGKGQFGKAANILKMSNPFSGRKQPWQPGKPSPNKDTFGDAWLEYHFGWEPMVKDVGAAANVMNKTDFGSKACQGNSQHQQRRSGSDSRNPIYKDNSGDWTLTDEVTVKLAGRATVTNPNAFLANQLGFANPLAVAWEAVPYSFVVDWFANVGQCIGAMNGFVGVSLANEYTTVFRRSRWQENHFIAFYNGINVGYGQSCHTVTCHRSLGISGPTLAVKPFKGFSPERAATAISLLLQFM